MGLFRSTYVCQRCNKKFRRSGQRYPSDSVFYDIKCKRCGRTLCDNCSRDYFNNDTRIKINYCRECYQDSVIYCADCHEYVNVDLIPGGIKHCHKCGKDICSECASVCKECGAASCKECSLPSKNDAFYYLCGSEKESLVPVCDFCLKAHSSYIKALELYNNSISKDNEVKTWPLTYQGKIPVDGAGMPLSSDYFQDKDDALKSLRIT